ncbi:Stp1/IreP family PP2C-type Ser/Thr phosphatase [Pullulanibacillus sp. KACC 23026]|uniref:Stp1/IreP family PP2C-type Ser/Thr phosphatase n=1 Tax=Pullulanibacillus sp. KACC 23026 TaxID=3028315 RepID=UPI0023B1B1AE|nr:Stp1/IreP family PP2C-type Ser/Thr phosphatase [Pullulanibacillus sp. KACC 23026]WEG11628.1 Stp1/IreP family PP2C-type Ser/Thr phosphatase [Pullulanibacillus sp. KACC 23026]
MNVIFQTDPGRVRDHNEDNGTVLVKEQAVLAVIADGMGGHLAGEEASALAVETIKEAWESYDPGDPTEDPRWLEETAMKANQVIYNHAESHSECKGMGTTLVMAICRTDCLTIAHVGDSRGYLVIDHETIKQITDDHSLVNQLVKAGQLSEEDADHHPRKNVLIRALGTDIHTEADVRRIEWQAHHCLLLCSDGLSDFVDKSTLLSIISSNHSIEQKATELIECANNAGGYDNISVLLVMNEDGEQP